MMRFALVLLASLAFVSTARAEELKELFYEPFDNGKEAGVVGKAGARLSVEGRDKIDLDRGTFAFFVKSPAAPEISEWNRLAGVNAQRANGYWGMVMSFEMRLDDFLFSLYDTGNYSPALKFQPNLGRWKAGEWHHLAAVWDRNEGVTIYEDGKRVASDWGRRRWEWSFVPATLFVNGPCDEVHVYASCLADAQIAQLARGEKPTGQPLSVTEPAKRRGADLARMGWDPEQVKRLASVEAGRGVQFTSARFLGCVDSRRPVAQPFEGVVDATWPLVKYGTSIRGRELEITLAPKSSYDHARLLLQRPFSGALVHRAEDGRETPLAAVEAGQPMVWHARLEGVVARDKLLLKRTTGQMGQIDFYRVEPLATAPKDGADLFFGQAQDFPKGEPGLALMGETPVRFRQPVAAATDGGPAWTLAAPAMGGFQAVTPPPADAQAFDGARVTLVAEGLSEPTPVRIVVKEPVLPQRNWLVADAVLVPKGAGRQVFTLALKGRPVVNLPPLRLPQKGKPAIDVPGVPFAVTVTAANPVSWAMGAGGCSVAFLTTDMAAALPAAVEDQVEFMREGYAELMEGHLYRDKHIQVPLTWLAKFAPDHPKFRQMYERVDSPQLFEGIAVPKIEWKETANASGAPDWAFWQMQAMKENLRIVHWYIDNAQVGTGEYGGIWNDDTDHVENWIEYALACDDTGKVKESLRKFWDGVWFLQLEQGVGKYPQDCCHFYEEGMGAHSMRSLVDYGDPVVMERVMAASSHYDKWLRFSPDGQCAWLSEYVSVNGAWTKGAFGENPRQGGHKWDIMVPAGYMVWYNRHPEAGKWYLGLPRGAGFHGGARDHLTGMDEARKRYIETAVSARGAKNDVRAVSMCIDEVGLTEEVRKAQGREYKPLGKIRHYISYSDTDEHWMLYQTTGDVRYLVDSYKRVCEWFNSHDWLNSAAMPSMDRNPLPRTSVARARIGSLAANRGASQLVWPYHALSYVKGGDQVAALVTENVANRLTARFYAFSDRPHDMTLRVWRMDPGTFKVTLFNDRDDDGRPEEAIMTREMPLDRGAFIDLTLPQRQCSILKIEAVKTQPMEFDLPDAAVSALDAEWPEGRPLQVRVHNIGRKPAENVLVRVRRGTAVLGEQRVDHIDAPLDLKPRVKVVSFPNLPVAGGSVTVEIDPDGKVADMNRHNNRIAVSPGAQPRPNFAEQTVAIPAENKDQPDAAVSLVDTELVYGEHLVVKVHNLGRKAVENVLVRVRDGRSGRIVVTGEQRVGRIDPPLDGKPRHKGVEFKNINANTCGSIIVEVDPDNEVPDFNRKNNRLELKY
jgi:hypothetical protein